jgi:hypothetical protein
MICSSSLCATARGWVVFFSPFLIGGCWISALEKAPVDARDCKERTAYYRDADGDGAGDDLEVVLGCAAPDGYVESGGDCDDQDATRALGCSDTGGDTGGDTGPAAPVLPT